ncbi:hypothetical protein AXG93_4698s1320 [Marchantia polymorpha subsp. ruderalis]|uniref:Uncharacterized protein n=1 Tax=Marchantia polymorpha subsp. ruderalis TaxID=1480154 RepID=A0A176VJI1_MARPO|nr:hypothetical protein AXG93_4698s1320 [Marchantia polymorpha subsp. ruderalis]
MITDGPQLFSTSMWLAVPARLATVLQPTAELRTSAPQVVLPGDWAGRQRPSSEVCPGSRRPEAQAKAQPPLCADPSIVITHDSREWICLVLQLRRSSHDTEPEVATSRDDDNDDEPRTGEVAMSVCLPACLPFRPPSPASGWGGAERSHLLPSPRAPACTTDLEVAAAQVNQLMHYDDASQSQTSKSVTFATPWIIPRASFSRSLVDKKHTVIQVMGV